MRAFTCGIDDLRLTPEGEANRHKALEPVGEIGLRVAASYVGLQDESPADTTPDLLERLEDVMRDDTKLDGLDVLMGKSGGELSTNVTFAPYAVASTRFANGTSSGMKMCASMSAAAAYAASAPAALPADGMAILRMP